jgi:PPOX class probable F420-dependent enzyme
MCRQVLTKSPSGASLRFTSTPLCRGRGRRLVVGTELVNSPPERPRGAIHPPAATSVLRSLVRLHDLLANARIVWLSSMRPDGRPHVVPTWFDWDGEVITVFTRPDAQKVRNVRHEPRVMLAIGRPEPSFEVELLEGDAAIVGGPAAGLHAVRPSARFAAKYADSLAETGRTVDGFATEFPNALRIRPTRLLYWGSRETTTA